ncbi:hypothetical protein [Nocardia otitidiscaviarum]|uniref:hypothetical protein n=1 Tax=Nocardia otitidiscaviarum TaxID=1823 RepID=UPI0011DCED9B|nr:hypothetical protein [Nocardia otitidiscaviarum]
MTDDPKRCAAHQNGEFTGGYLYGPSPRSRLLRVLLDLDSLKDLRGTPQWKQFEQLCGYDLVVVWKISLSRMEPPPPHPEAGTLYLYDTTEAKGPFGLYGAQYSWHLGDRGGVVSPSTREEQAFVHHIDSGGEIGTGISAPDVQRAVLLSETARAVGADIVVSALPTVGRTDVAANYAANFFTPADIPPIVCHYLRTQHVYPLPGSRATTSRQNFYEMALGATASGVFDWHEKCRRDFCQAPSRADGSIHLDSSTEMIIRLVRALKTWDELLFLVGGPPSNESSDDTADALDHILLMLCGAVDVLARSLHKALDLAGKPSSAKLHIREWYDNKFRPHFEAHNEIHRLDALQESVQVVFDLRNTIHNLALKAVGGFIVPNPFVGAEKGRRTLLIPPDSGEKLRNLDTASQRRWGLLTSGQLTSADLAQLTAMSISSVCAFLGQICRILASTDVQDKDTVLEGTASWPNPVVNQRSIEIIGSWVALPDPLA